MRTQDVVTNRRMLLKLVAGVGTATVVGGGLAACSSTSSATNSSSSASSSSSNLTDLGANNSSLFDGQAHEVKLEIANSDLQSMLTAYQQDSSKDWGTAKITIDGTTIENVGVRLKGNSTVKSLQNISIDDSGNITQSSSSSTDSSNQGGGGQAPAGGQMPTDMPTDMAQAPTDGGQAPAGGGQAPAGGGGGMGGDSSIDATDLATWPFMIAFDKNTDNQVYQGYSRMSLRPGIPVLNEAISLSMTAATSQPSQKYAYVKYTINDNPTTTRLLIVVPDENYAAELGDGILYKLDSEANFSYQDDNEDTYTDQFKQVNGDDDEKPIINLLKWLDSVSDTDFANQLGQYVDVDSFAKYVATQNLLVNSDDIAGPGKNGYLWYDNSTKLISIVSWDLDMTMSNSTSAGPDDSVSMGGGGMGGGQQGGAPQGGGAPGQSTTDSSASSTDSTASSSATASASADASSSTDTTQGNAPAGGGMSSGNSLKEKFLAADGLSDTYHKAYWDLFDQIYGNDAAQNKLTELSKIIPVTDGFTQDSLDSADSTLTNWISQRKTALESVRSETDTSSN